MAFEIPPPVSGELPADHATLASALDLHLLDPAMPETELYEGCRTARNWKVGTVVVRPSDVDLAVRWLDGTGVTVCGTVSFPHGASSTSTKLYETHDVLRRGAREVEVVLNIGKLAARHFQYCEYELLQLAEQCHKVGAKIKAVFETVWMTDEAKIVAAKICKRSSVDLASLATGYADRPWTERDLHLLLWKCLPLTEVKAPGIASLDAALGLWQAGVRRIGVRDPIPLLEEWEKRLAARPS